MEIAVHDIVYLKKMEAVDIFGQWPQWTREDEMAQKIAVVRRMMTPNNKVAIGFRGDDRTKRLAAITQKSNIERIIHPFEIIHNIPPTSHVGTVRGLVELLTDYKWGIGGSVGFTMSTGIQACHNKSDVDVILYSESISEIEQFVHLYPKLKVFEHHIDVQVEINNLGAVILEDYINNDSFLLRTATGPMLLNKSDLLKI